MSKLSFPNPLHTIEKETIDRLEAIATIAKAKGNIESPLRGTPGKTFQFPIWKAILEGRLSAPMMQLEITKCKAHVCTVRQRAWGEYNFIHPVEYAIEYADWMIRRFDSESQFEENREKFGKLYECFLCYLH